MRSVLALALLAAASASPSLRAGAQWGPDLKAEAKSFSAGSDKWDTEDKADVDEKLMAPIFKDGDFFSQFFTPAGGFMTPVGEQAACIVDKASHVMNFHFCHDDLRRTFKKTYKQDCDRLFVKNAITDISECCLGEAHIPLWSQMHTCKKKTAPITAFMTKHLGQFDQCMKKTEALTTGKKAIQDTAAEDKTPACAKAVAIVPAVAKRLFKLGTELYVQGHKLDLTKHAKDFMQLCEPGLENAPSKKRPHALFTRKCRNKLAEMWTAVTKEDTSEEIEDLKKPSTINNANADDDWSV